MYENYHKQYKDDVKGGREGRRETTWIRHSERTVQLHPLYSLLTFIQHTHLDSFNHSDYLYRLLHRLTPFVAAGLKEKLNKSPLFRYAHDLDLVITIRPLKSVSLKNTILLGLLFRYNTR